MKDGYPRPHAARISRFWTYTIVIVIVWFGFWLSRPQLLCGPRKATLTQALSNARQIGLALFDFDTEYGSYPNSSTITAVSENHPGWMLDDATSNDLFKQLFAAKVTSDEGIFHVKLPGTRKPDHITSPRSKILEEGECGFGYIIPGTTSISSSQPLLVTPLIPGTSKFDPGPFKAKALIMRRDLSVASCKLIPNGTAIDTNGMDIFDPRQPYWGGVAPIIKPPNLPFYTPSPPPRDRRDLFVAIGAPSVALIGTAIWVFRRARSRAGSTTLRTGKLP
jgi:hypothetical protein